MAIDKALGNKRLLYIRSGADWFPIGCLTGNSMSENTDTIDTTVRGNANGWRSARPTSQNLDLSFSGLISIVPDPAKISYQQIKAFKRNRTVIEWRLYSDDITEADEGKGIIISLSDEAPLNDVVEFSGSILSIGEPTNSNQPPVITRRWVEVGEAWVFKADGNTNEAAVEIGDVVRYYLSNDSRYVHGKVNNLPYTDPANLSIFEDIILF